MYVYIFTFLKVIQLMMIKAKLLEKLRTNRVWESHGGLLARGHGSMDWA